MIQKATAMTVRQNLGELLNEVQYKHDTVLITKAGKAVAAIVDIPLFEKIRKMKEQFEALSAELAMACKEENTDVVEKEVTEAIKSLRGQD